MLYAILCYHDEAITSAWSDAHDAEVIGALREVQRKWAGRFGPVARLMPTSAATTLDKSRNLVLDGPFAETKEQLLGFYVVEVDGLDQALEIAGELAGANPGGSYELRPIAEYRPGREAADDARAP